MICPYCSHECDAHAHYCSFCGAPLTEIPRVKRGRHWVPILIMVLILSFGTSLFFLLPGTSAPDNSGNDQEDWFSIDNGILYFDSTKYDGGSELQIPETINGITVTALANSCFENCTNLTSVILPDTLQAIGENAFRGCTALRGIEIPDSVFLIGENAFSDCTSLEAICVYDTIRSIGAGAFSDCSKLFYIYYSGYFQEWNELYGEFINPYSTVFAADGSFFQGEPVK